MRKIYEQLTEELLKLNINITFIGSFPLYYLYSNERLRHVDDLDLVVFSDHDLDEVHSYISRLNGSWEKQQLEDKRKIFTTSGIRTKTRTYPGFLYGSKFVYNGKNVDLCVFPNGIVNIIKVDCKDIINIGNKKIPIPCLGIFYITRLHPYAVTDKRIKNTALVINNRPEDPENLAYVSREALRKAVLDYELEEEILQRTRNRCMNRETDKFKQYIDLTYDIPYLTRGIY